MKHAPAYRKRGSVPVGFQYDFKAKARLFQRFKKLIHRPYIDTIFSTEGVATVIEENAANQARQVLNGA